MQNYPNLKKILNEIVNNDHQYEHVKTDFLPERSLKIINMPGDEDRDRDNGKG
jgi:RNA-binding protein YlmH